MSSGTAVHALVVEDDDGQPAAAQSLPRRGRGLRRRRGRRRRSGGAAGDLRPGARRRRARPRPPGPRRARGAAPASGATAASPSSCSPVGTTRAVEARRLRGRRRRLRGEALLAARDRRPPAALVRRGYASPAGALRVRRLVVDAGGATATLDGQAPRCGRRSSRCSPSSWSSPGRCSHREELLEHVWGSTGRVAAGGDGDRARAPAPPTPGQRPDDGWHRDRAGNRLPVHRVAGARPAPGRRQLRRGVEGFGGAGGRLAHLDDGAVGEGVRRLRAPPLHRRPAPTGGRRPPAAPPSRPRATPGAPAPSSSRSSSARSASGNRAAPVDTQVGGPEAGELDGAGLDLLR